MDGVTHRQLRNESGEVLRRVADGETLLVTNHGRVAAVIGPPPRDALSALADAGEVRQAIASPAGLTAIRRRKVSGSVAEILADVRGRW